MTFENDLLRQTKKRIDGRRFDQRREVHFDFQNAGSVIVSLGEGTKVVASVTGTITKPNPDRPFEGAVNFTVGFVEGKSTKEGIAGGFIEKVWRETKPIDLESLCIVAGKQIWSIRIDVRILQDDGNLIECMSLALLAAVLSFRRPSLKVVGDEVTVYDPKEKLPVPLGLHHLPYGLEIGVLSGIEDGYLIDPSLQESLFCDLLVISAVNNQKEICFTMKQGNSCISIEQLTFLNQIAMTKSLESIEFVKGIANK